MTTPPRFPATIVWFRRDLRLSDNPAVEAAVARGGAVVAAWVHAPGEEGGSAPGASRRSCSTTASSSRPPGSGPWPPSPGGFPEPPPERADLSRHRMQEWGSLSARGRGCGIWRPS
jgi:DNA photolyase